MTQNYGRKSKLRWDPQAIDKKWQGKWAADKLHHVADDDPRPKWYEMTMYPYPSGDVHIGHWYAMAPSDAHARFRKMQGYNVLHPMGFDAFGLPAVRASTPTHGRWQILTGCAANFGLWAPSTIGIGR
jgi:leucyl-tRNA synthetase